MTWREPPRILEYLECSECGSRDLILTTDSDWDEVDRRRLDANQVEPPRRWVVACEFGHEYRAAEGLNIRINWHSRVVPKRDSEDYG